MLHAKEPLLVEVKASLSRSRAVYVFGVYAHIRDVTRRLGRILRLEAIRVAVLTNNVEPKPRQAWYERQSRQGASNEFCNVRARV